MDPISMNALSPALAPAFGVNALASPLTPDIYTDVEGFWRWRLRHWNGRIVADSSEGYARRSDCEHGLSLVSNWRL